jgi:predicted molibdopterin-dependent oxidoreductase YjgC
MKEITLTIDGKKIKASEGDNILFAALENGIYIPNLCAIREKVNSPASCRLCFVEVEGEEEPVTACTQPVKEGMVAHTRGKIAQRLARTSLELLLSNHPLDCAHCSKNRSCELLKIAKHLRIKVKANRFRRLDRKLPLDDSSSVFTYDPIEIIQPPGLIFNQIRVSSQQFYNCIIVVCKLISHDFILRLVLPVLEDALPGPLTASSVFSPPTTAGRLQKKT